MNDWYKSKLFWLGVLQILVSVGEYLAGVPAGTSLITVATGIITIVLKFLQQSSAAGALTLADAARLNWLERLYAKIWFNVEALWIKSASLRRPFTYMMRDFILEHKAWSAVIIVMEIVGLMFLTRWNWVGGFFATAIYFLVLGHLVWGTPMVHGEQEYPEYTDNIY